MNTKYKLLFSFQCLLVFSAISCSDEVNPFSEFKKNYVVNCALDESSDYQKVTISYTYNDEQRNKSEFSHEVRNAKVKIFSDTDTYIFEEQTSDRKDKTLYKDSVVFYSCKGFKPVQGQKYNLEAVLEDGSLIKATTTVPKANLVKHLLTDLIFDEPKEYAFLYFYRDDRDPTRFLVLPRLHFCYNYLSSGKFEKRDIIIPAEKILKEGQTVYMPHKLSIYPYGYYKQDIILETLEGFYKQDTAKNHYQILGAKIEMVVLDDNLGKYYRTNEAATEGISIILDNYDYTNIEGALGFFGSFIRHYEYIKLDMGFFYVRGFKTLYMNMKNF